MNPFADFLFFGVMLYILIPTILLGLFGRANARWAIVANLAALAVIFSGDLAFRPGISLPFVGIVAGYALYQLILVTCFFRWRSRPFFYIAVALAIVPLACTKF